jgi:hypothetical protein
MKLPNWLRRGIGAFKETVNLVSLTILIAASTLTGDWGLFFIGVAVETAYLAVAFLLTCYLLCSNQFVHRKFPWVASYRSYLESWRLQSRNEDEDEDNEENFVLDQALLIVTIAGFVVIIFFGFGKHLLTHPWYKLSHAAGWEAGAIGWTGLFLIYYILKFKSTGNVTVDKIIFGALLIGNGALLWFAWRSIGEKSLKHVLFVMGIAALFLGIDLLSGLVHKNKLEKRRSRAALWVDIPMVIAFLVLLPYLWMHQDTEAPEVFVAGVIACQLLISNVLFVVTEFGFLRLPTTIGTPRDQQQRQTHTGLARQESQS